MLALLGVPVSEISSDEPEGLCGSSWTVISVEGQLDLAFPDFLGLNIIGDRLMGWIRARNTEDGGVRAFSSAGICRKIVSWSMMALQAVLIVSFRHSWLRGSESSANRQNVDVWLTAVRQSRMPTSSSASASLLGSAR